MEYGGGEQHQDERLRQATRDTIARNPQSAFAFVGGMYVGSVQFQEALRYAARQDQRRTLGLLTRRMAYYEREQAKGSLNESAAKNLQILNDAIRKVQDAALEAINRQAGD